MDLDLHRSCLRKQKAPICGKNRQLSDQEAVIIPYRPTAGNPLELIQVVLRLSSTNHITSPVYLGTNIKLRENEVLFHRPAVKRRCRRQDMSIIGNYIGLSSRSLCIILHTTW